MKINQFIFLFLLFVTGLFSLKVVFGLFTSAASNNNNIFTASNEFPTATPTSTPAITNTPTPTPTIQAGDVVINEINWAGNNDHTSDEWIELRNMTFNAIDLSNWVVQNLGDSTNPDIIIPSGKSISPNGFFLVSNYSKTHSDSRLNVDSDYVTPSVSLDNDGEQLRLKTSTGTLIDTANDTNDWFAGSNVITPTPLKKSMERKDPPGDGTVSTNWQTAATAVNLDVGATELATPKAANGP